MEDPCLVEHRVHLGHQAEDCKPDSSVSEEGAGETGDDKEVVDEQLAGLRLQHHVQSLSQVNPDGEGSQPLGRLCRVEHEVAPHLSASQERSDCPAGSDCRGHSCHRG